MKEINSELTKQELYKEVNRCVSPLLPPFQVIEKRGSASKNNNVIDYSVTLFRRRSTTINSWPTPSSTTSLNKPLIKSRPSSATARS